MSKGKNLLLIIGIDKYANSSFHKLNNAVYDAKRIMSILTKRYGFEMAADPLFDEVATRENILGTVHSVANSLHESDNLIIYFAGHGIIDINKKGYWVPHDARHHVADFIPNSTIKDVIETTRAKHIFLIIDSCFSGTFLTTTRSGTQEVFYEKLENFKSRWVLTSGREEKVSDGRPGEGSPFCNYLLRILEGNSNKYLSVLEIINYVTKITAANSAQLPLGSHIENVGHEGGQLVLRQLHEFVQDTTRQTSGLPNSDDLVREIDAVDSIGNRLAVGKEIVLIESYMDDVDYMILELFRFDDEGNKRHVFDENVIRFEAKDGLIEWKVIGRFATWTGLDRFLERNEVVKKKRVAIFNAAPEIENVESSNSAIKRRQVLDSIFKKNNAIMSCLHCGKKISTNDSLLVEVDEVGLKLNVGNVHKECIRPVDRVLGVSGYEGLENDYLINFDFEKWVELLATGQGMINSLKHVTDRDAVLAWNPNHRENHGNFCVKAILENKEIQFVRKGKEIHRFTEHEIDDEVSWFNSRLAQGVKNNNPFCYTSVKKTFGPYSILVKVKLPEEDIIEIKTFEKALYSNQLEAIKRDVENDYAPVCILQKTKSEQIVALSNLIPIISNPANLKSMLNNWRKAAFEIADFEVRIIESDQEFDQLMAGSFVHGLQPILDPLFDRHAELMSGHFIIDTTSFRDSKNARGNLDDLLKVSNPNWFKGDIVVARLPGASKEPTGMLLEDELEDQNGERVVIFRAMENGEAVSELTYRIPSKYIVKTTEGKD